MANYAQRRMNGSYHLWATIALCLTRFLSSKNCNPWKGTSIARKAKIDEQL